MKTTITNISKARQGIQTPNGLAWIKPDETRTLDLDEESHARVIELEDLLRIGNGSEVKNIAAMLEAKGKGGEMLQEGSLPEGVTVGERVGYEAVRGNDAFDLMTDEQLAALYLDQFGKAPHHKAKRETIIAKLRGK